MQKETVNRQRAEFCRSVQALRQELEYCAGGGILQDDFVPRLAALRKEEEKLLGAAVADYRKIRLQDHYPRCHIKTLLDDLKDLEGTNPLSDREKAAFAEFQSEQEEALFASAEKVLPGVSSALVLNDAEGICGLEDGRMAFLSVRKGKSDIEAMFQALPDAVLSLQLLKSEINTVSRTEEQPVLLTGTRGWLALVSRKRGLIRRRQLHEENLFAAASSAGTAIILGEEGNVYYLEKNRDAWYLLEKPILCGYFAYKISAVETDSYLLLNVDDKLDRLTIERIRTPQELWNDPLF